MEFPTILGYLSGLYFIKPDLDVSTLIHTSSLVHLADALLCCLIAAHTGRSKKIWTAAGLFLGVWALGTLFLLHEKRQEKNREN